MTEDELREQCRLTVAKIEGCIDNNGELYDTVAAVDAVMALCKRMIAVGLREAADVAQLKIATHDAAIEGCDGDEWIRHNAIIAEFSHFVKWAKLQAKEREG